MCNSHLNSSTEKNHQKNVCCAHLSLSSAVMCLTGVVHNHTSHVEEDAHNPQNTHVYVSTYRAWSTNPGLTEEVDNHCR